MKASLAVACAVLLSLGAVTPDERRQVGEDGEVGEDEVACLADPAASAELSVISGQNATGHWLAKVRLLHAAGEAGDGASLPPVHLQLQRSAQRRRGGARTVALEATLAGSPTIRPDHPAGSSGILNSSDPGTACPPPRPCPTLPKSQPCPSPCPAPCPACPSCPEPPTCPALSPVSKRLPPGYQFKEGFGYYKHHTVPVDWYEAKATCEREGAHLVILNSKDEAEMVMNFFTEYNFPDLATGIRVGLHDLVKKGSFLTVLGEPIADTGFADWRAEEPNSDGDCVAIYGTQIYCISCESKGTFVCELPN